MSAAPTERHTSPLVILNEVKDLLSALYKSPQPGPYDYFAVSWLFLWFLYKKKVFLKV